MSQVHDVNDLNFEREVLESPTPVLLDCSAAWCGPCKALLPVLETLASEGKGAFKVAKLDVDEAPAVATRLGIRGMPTLLVFQDGHELRRRVGAASKSALLAMLTG